MNEDKCEIPEALKASPHLAHQGFVPPEPITLYLKGGGVDGAAPSLVPLRVPPSSLAFLLAPPST